MRKNLVTMLVASGILTLSSCDATEQSNTTTEVLTEEAVPPMSYGDEGSVYIDENGVPIVQILSKDDNALNLRLTQSGTILSLKKTEGEAGLYRDEDGNSAAFDTADGTTMTLSYKSEAEFTQKVLTLKDPS